MSEKTKSNNKIKDDNNSNKDHLQEMINEQGRLATFKGWPFKRGPCTKEKMAQAGFYRKSSNDDGVECFICLINLDGWEQSDEPFKEHIEHSPQCPFAQAQKAQGDLTVRDWIDILRVRNDKINEKRLQSMQEKLEKKISMLAELCSFKKE